MSNFHDHMRSGSHTDKRSASSVFLGQHTNTVRARRRADIKACGGIRQFKRQSRLGLATLR